MTKSASKLFLIAFFLFTSFIILIKFNKKDFPLKPDSFNVLKFQVYPLINNKEDFTNQTLSTIVFAYNPEKIKSPPKSWAELKNSNFSVSFPKCDCCARCVIASASFALSGRDDAVELFRTIKNKNLLSFNKNQDINLMFDFEVNQKILSGENLSFIIPNDGTLSFVSGYFYKSGTTIPSDSDLIKSGYRLIDGRSSNLLPSHNANYDKAFIFNNYTSFSKLTRKTTPIVKREIFRKNLFSSSDGDEHIYSFILTMFILILWSITAIHRCPCNSTKNWILFIRFLLLTWLFITLVKYQIPGTFLSRIFWYSFHVFTVGLPLSLLRITSSINSPNKRTPKYINYISLVFPLLLVMVYTNDLTQFVFKFDFNGNWEDEYSYGTGYVILFTYGVFLLVLSLTYLIKQSFKSPKAFASLYPLLTTFILVLYNVLYALNVPIARESILTINFTIFVVLFLESLLRSGLFHTNTHYKELFFLSPFNMRILDDEGNSVITSPKAKNLCEADKIAIKSSPSKSFYKDENTLIRSLQISGGFAVWEEDMTSINEVRNLIEGELIELRSINALLEKENHIRKKKLSIQIEEKMFADLESNIESKIERLINCIDKLPYSAEKENTLTQITIFLCHIKRHCNLFFSAIQKESFSSFDLSVYIDELSDIAAYAEHGAVVRSSLDKNISVKNAIILYNFYFEVLLWFVRSNLSSLIGTIELRDIKIYFTILLSKNCEDIVFPEKLLGYIKNLNGEIKYLSIDESDSITLIIPTREVI